MKIKDIMKAMERNFESKLEKTNYGRNEIKALHREAVNETLMEILDSQD